MKIWNFLKNNIYAKNISLAFLVIIILFIGLKWWLNIYTHHGQAVVVPDVKGLSVQEAAAFFDNSHLKYEVIDSVYNKDTKPGIIVETIPTEGTKVKEHRTIYVTINANSSRTSIIPDVKDQSYRQAIAKLNAIGFKDIQVKSVPAAYKDLVLGLEYGGRSVNAGERLPLDSKLVLLVSDGAQGMDGISENAADSDANVPVDESWLN